MGRYKPAIFVSEEAVECLDVSTKNKQGDSKKSY